jgi:hypothetical protein
MPQPPPDSLVKSLDDALGVPRSRQDTSDRRITASLSGQRSRTDRRSSRASQARSPYGGPSLVPVPTVAEAAAREVRAGMCASASTKGDTGPRNTGAHAPDLKSRRP